MEKLIKKIILRCYCHLYFRPLHFVKYDLLKMHLLNQKQLEDYRTDLAKTKHNSNKQTISFTGKSRKIKSPNQNFGKFLAKIKQNTKDLKAVEVIFAIDPDDDIKYYARLKNQYDKYFKVVILIAPERYGYNMLHMYDKMVYKYLSSNSKQIIVATDDIYIGIDGYDNLLCELQSKYKDDIYYVSTFAPEKFNAMKKARLEFIKDYDSSEPIVLSVMLKSAKFGCIANYPIFSTKILHVAREVLNSSDFTIEERKNFSPIANSWANDMVFDLIMFELLNLGIDRVVGIKQIITDPGRYMKYNHAGRKRDKHDLLPFDKALIDILSSKNLNHYRNISRELYRVIKDN